MFGTKKKPTGEALIDAVAGQFDQMVADLDTGVSDCEQEKSGVEAQIAALQVRQTVLESAMVRARNLAGNLRKLMSD